MMKLLVDIGNSRIKWAFAGPDGFVAQGEWERGAAASLAVLVDAGHAPEQIRIANVAGADEGNRIAALLAERFHVSPEFAGSAAAGGGVRNGYAIPGQLGVDRWLALCAAFVRYQAPLCVVDAGTATTLDLLSGRGEHQGGLILPGLELMEAALLRRTGNLARLSADAITSPSAPALATAPAGPAFCLTMGRDTAAAIHLGALQATTSLARECMARLCRAEPAPVRSPVLVITGGAAGDLHGALCLSHDPEAAAGFRAYSIEHRQHLVLEGLAIDPPCYSIVR